MDEQGPGRRGGAGVRGTSYQCYIQWKLSTVNIVGTKVSVTFMSLDTDSHTRPFSLFSQKHCQGRPLSLYQNFHYRAFFQWLVSHTLLILALSTSLTPTLCTLSITSPSPSPSLSLASPHHTLRPAATLLTQDQCPQVGQPC